MLSKQSNFSIIIPTYNEDKEVLLTLQSIINSIDTKKYLYEIIVIDGCSSDKTVLYAKQFLEKQKGISYKVISLSKRAYPGKSRNHGIKAASNDQLIFIDCGVTINAKFINTCHTYISDFDFIWFAPKFKCNRLIGYAMIRSFFVKRKQGRYIRHFAINKNMFSKYGGFREDLRAAEDWLFYKKIKNNSNKEFFSLVTATYTGCPKTLLLFYKKWQMYYCNSVYAKSYYKNLMFLLILLLFYSILVLGWYLLVTSLFLSIIYAIPIYILIRGYISVYRSKIPLTSILDYLLTLITSLIIDFAKLTGLIKGLLTKNNQKKPT